MSESLQDRIMRHEGFCAIPKLDVAPMYVIGFGHDITEMQRDNYSNGISISDATALLDKDIAASTLEVSTEIPWSVHLDEIKQEVLIEMAFQIGIHGLLGFHNMLLCAKNGDDSGVVANMLNSEWHKQTPSRCEELANLWINKGDPT